MQMHFGSQLQFGKFSSLPFQFGSLHKEIVSIFRVPLKSHQNFVCETNLDLPSGYYCFLERLFSFKFLFYFILLLGDSRLFHKKINYLLKRPIFVGGTDPGPS